MDYLSVSDAARELGLRPRAISDAFYSRKLDDSMCPVVGRRRLIPRQYLPVIQRVLKDERNRSSSKPVDSTHQ